MLLIARYMDCKRVYYYSGFKFVVGDARVVVGGQQGCDNQAWTLMRLLFGSNETVTATNSNL
jgi:hypothetical protein